MVLLSLYRAAGGGSRRVPYEDLVLQAWRDYPEAFSLRNHPEHPDASDIHKKLYQSLKFNGFVIALGNKFFRLTEDGVANARALTQMGPSDSSSAGARLSREHERFLLQARTTRAFHAWIEDRKGDLVNHDCRLFFGYGATTPRTVRSQRVQHAKQAIAQAFILHFPDAGALRDLACHLEAKFLSTQSR